jgi:hypothetical protein
MLNQIVDTLNSHPIATVLIAFIILAALTAVANYILAKRAEWVNPPKGRFVMAQGHRFHYLVEPVGSWRLGGGAGAPAHSIVCGARAAAQIGFIRRRGFSLRPAS